MKRDELKEAKKLLKEATAKIDAAMKPRNKDKTFCHGVACGDKYSCERYIYGKNQGGWFVSTFRNEKGVCSKYQVSTANLVAQTLFVTESGEKQYDNFEILGAKED